MFPSDEFWQSAAFGAVIGGIITVVLLKVLDTKGATLRKAGATDKSKKRPTEHDERF